MATEAAIRGYLREEAIAWLLGRSGYQLLVDESDDPQDLIWGGNGLRVHGRGADHQADTLGELSFVPPFSLPIRLFVEAKFRGTVAHIRDVRNAHGVIHDINENFSRLNSTGRPPALPIHVRPFLYVRLLQGRPGLRVGAPDFTD